jgi:DNA-binding XRE family transcriptional regulator
VARRRDDRLQSHLRDRRHGRRLAQMDLARKVGATRQALHAIERDVVPAPAWLAIKSHSVRLV